MLGRLFGGDLFKPSGFGQGGPRSDSLLYAIGDIHGRIDLLIPLTERLLGDALSFAQENAKAPEVVFVGDMIDRGPHSQQVIEFLMAVQEWPELDPVFLVGNHELMLLQFLDNPVEGRRWLRYGGYETLVSYGLGKIGDIGDGDELHRIAEDLRAAMGPHLGFIENLKAWHANGNVLFAHAGADPVLPPAEQPIEALIWGTPEFERTRRPDGMWVVHGHTVVEEPTVRLGRIPIDTGAYITGKLTAFRLRGDEIGFLTEQGATALEDANTWED